MQGHTRSLISFCAKLNIAKIKHLTKIKLNMPAGQEQLTIEDTLMLFSDGTSICYNCDRVDPITLCNNEDDTHGLQFDQEHRNVVFSDSPIQIVVKIRGYGETLSIPVPTVGNIMNAICDFFSKPLTQKQRDELLDYDSEFLGQSKIHTFYSGLKRVGTTKVYTIEWSS